jgi:hypothetical protein
MKNSLRFVGLDVHGETIVAVAEAGGEVRDLGIIANRPEAVRNMVAVWVPDKDHEPLRDLVRQREAAGIGR